MRYVALIDWENIWYEHVQRAFPGFRLPNEDPTRLPVTPVTPAMVANLEAFPSLIQPILTKALGHPPQEIVAVAIWDNLPLKDHMDIVKTCKEAGIRTDRPAIERERIKDRHAKNASDFRLMLEAAQQAFSGSANLDTIVLMSGDHIFAHVIDYLATKSNKAVRLSCFCHNISGDLRKRMIRHFSEKHIHFIDEHHSYKVLKRDGHKLDLLHKHKLNVNPSVAELVSKTAIKRINERKTKSVKYDDFIDWIARWLDYWDQECGIAKKNAAVHWYKYLRDSKKIITENSATGTVNVELVSAGNREIGNSVKLFKAHRYGYEHLYDVPPAYYKR